MKRKFIAGVLSFLLAVSTMAETAAAAELTDNAEVSEAAQISLENRIWDLSSDTTAERPLVEGTTGEFDGILIDATNGKFAPRTPETGGTDTQINAGTILTIPVAANNDGAQLTINLSGGTGTVEINGQSYTDTSKVISVDLPASEEDTTCDVTFVPNSDGSNTPHVELEPSEFGTKVTSQDVSSSDAGRSTEITLEASV